jgi:hypothetical protein
MKIMLTMYMTPPVASLGTGRRNLEHHLAISLHWKVNLIEKKWL